MWVECRSGKECWQIMLSGRDTSERPESVDNSVYHLFLTRNIDMGSNVAWFFFFFKKFGAFVEQMLAFCHSAHLFPFVLLGCLTSVSAQASVALVTCALGAASHRTPDLESSVSSQSQSSRESVFHADTASISETEPADNTKIRYVRFLGFTSMEDG